MRQSTGGCKACSELMLDPYVKAGNIMLHALTFWYFMPQSRRTDPLKKPGKPLQGLAGVGIAGLIVILLTALLNARVALTEGPPPKTPLTVDTVEHHLQDSYSRTVSYLGLVVAGRKANLAFEIPGTIASLPHRQGSPVNAGDIIARLDDASLQAHRRSTAATLKQAQAELELARLKAERQEDLRATDAVSREAFDETRLRARALQAQVEAVSAQLAGIDIDIEKSRLKAPYEGLIADHYVHEGAVVNPGVPVVRLLETKKREAHIGVAAARARSLERGGHYTLTLNDRQIAAELLTVRPDVDAVTRSATAVFALPGDIDVLDGEPVNLELEQGVAQTGGWLPISALLEGERGVWTVLRIEMNGESTVTVREGVEVLDIRGDRAFVRGTLPDGSRVVATGLHRVTPGTPVIVRGSR